MIDHYILIGQTPVIEPDFLAWARWFEAGENRQVGSTKVGSVLVSTVFLGLDHRFSGVGPPILFETMTFSDDDSDKDICCLRCCTWLEAEAQHARVVKLVEEGRLEEA